MHPYSIYVDKRPMRIAFLVDPSPDSIETVDQIIGYNRGLWGGRYNPIILTDGNTIEDKWWEFLRDVDPDIIKPLVPLNVELVKKFEKFLSPLTIEKFRENTQPDSLTRVNTSITPAGIDSNSPNIYKNLILLGEPVLGTFNVDEIDDDVGKLFLHRNFGISASGGWHLGLDGFSIPLSLEASLSRGEVPPEVHEEFKKKELDKRGIPFSKEAFSKRSTRHPEKWAIIDKENNRIHYVEHRSGKLFVCPYRESSDLNLNEIEKKTHLVHDRESMADALSELAHTQNIVYRDQICAFPNTEKDIQNGWKSDFEVVVGDTLQDIVHFRNRDWLLSRQKRKRMNQLWLPTTLATDPTMEEALCSWIDRNTWGKNGNPKTVDFVTFSIENRELKNIADQFKRTLGAFTHAKHYAEPQIPSLVSEHLSFFFSENPLSSRDSSIETCRAQGNQDLLELTEPNGLDQHDLNGHWMADFYIEFTCNRYGNDEDAIKRMDGHFLFRMFPARNHLTSSMFNRFSRIRLNGLPSTLMNRGENVLTLTLSDSESVVKSLFCNSNRRVYVDGDPRYQVSTAPYWHTDVSDKGKYLQGVLELFGSLTFAYDVFSNSYWCTMFDFLSKNTGAQQNAKKSVANKLRKLIDRSGPLTSANQDAIKSLATQTVNLAQKLTLKKREFSFKKFIAEAQRQKEKNVNNPLLVNDQYGTDLLFQLFDPSEVLAFANRGHEMDIVDFGFMPEDVKDALSQLTERNIIQIGVKPRCPNCGMANWYYVDDIRQQLTCQGCRVLFPLDPELTWQYRLNSLVHAAYALHGTMPLILVLGQLLYESNTSFLFSPNLNLLVKSQNKSSSELKTAAEVDIACIRDGKFIIGEVKQSIRLFGKKDFDDMAEIAEKTKPDIVLFSCVDQQQPTKFITDEIERIQSKLSPLEIDVIWYELKYLDSSYSPYLDSSYSV